MAGEQKGEERAVDMAEGRERHMHTRTHAQTHAPTHARTHPRGPVRSATGPGRETLNRNVVLLADFSCSPSFSASCSFLCVSVSWQLAPPRPLVAKNTSQSYAVSNSRPGVNLWGSQTSPKVPGLRPLKGHQCILAGPRKRVKPF